MCVNLVLTQIGPFVQCQPLGPTHVLELHLWVRLRKALIYYWLFPRQIYILKLHFGSLRALLKAGLMFHGCISVDKNLRSFLNDNHYAYSSHTQPLPPIVGFVCVCEINVQFPDPSVISSAGNNCALQKKSGGSLRLTYN